MFERSPLPMWTFDEDTLRFVTVNDAAVRLYGYRREEMLAMTITAICPPDDTPQSAQSTSRHRRKDGSVITVELAANDFVIDGNHVRLVVANDVTERDRARDSARRSDEQLLQAQKMNAVGQLTAGVAHEVNNMLAVIASYAHLLEDSLGTGDVRRRDATEIRLASERAAVITRQLLTLSRHSVVTPRAIDLGVTLAGIIPMLNHLVDARIEIVVHQSAVPDVLADPGEVTQVLMNLVVNARDAMPDGGRITIETELLVVEDERAATVGLRARRYGVLAVTDTGGGMDAETQRKIFDPFFTTKAIGKGTGLGLSIVHGIVARAGGAIAVSSKPGHGATFRIMFPVAGTADD